MGSKIYSTGFTPLFDTLVSSYGRTTALVYGVIWRHCQMSRRVCDASYATLSKEIGVSKRTIPRCVKTLLTDKYIEILSSTPGGIIVFSVTEKIRVIPVVVEEEDLNL